jgi:hypothetical protein
MALMKSDVPDTSDQRNLKAQFTLILHNGGGGA